MPSTVSAMGRTAILLACTGISIKQINHTQGYVTYVFDIGARVDGDHVTMLYPKVVADDSVDASTAVIKLIVGQDNKDSVLALLSPY